MKGRAKKTVQRKVVVITGASAGVGRATAWEFAKQGAAVALLARGQAGLDAAQREVEELGGQALVIRTDVADPDQVETAAEQVEAKLGPIDVWVNNAMTTVFATVLDIDPKDFKRATEVTYLGAVHGTMSALRRMKARNRGSIVQVGSALAYRAIPLQAPYCGAKHALRGFTDALRSELIHDKSEVQITMVQLPALNTPQFAWCKSKLKEHPQPVPPIFQPEVAARAIVWASQHKRRELHVGFPTLKTIWTNKFFPGFADWYAARAGISGQKSSFDRQQERGFNLYEPMDAAHDWGCRGRFSERSQTHSYHLWWTTHRSWLSAAALVVVLLSARILWMIQG